jgi:hypothetical protein
MPVKVRVGAVLTLGGGVALLALMFATRWYGVVGPGTGVNQSRIQGAVGLWSQLRIVRWLVLVTALVAAGSALVHVAQRASGAQWSLAPAIAVLGSVTSAALFYRVLVALPAPRSVVDAKIGAYLGLVSAVAIALGGIDAVRQAGEARAPHRRQAAR